MALSLHTMEMVLQWYAMVCYDMQRKYHFLCIPLQYHCNVMKWYAKEITMPMHTIGMYKQWYFLCIPLHIIAWYSMVCIGNGISFAYHCNTIVIVCNENTITYAYHCIPLQYHEMPCNAMQRKYQCLWIGISISFTYHCMHCMVFQWYFNGMQRQYRCMVCILENP
jgi:hypothetical protein